MKVLITTPLYHPENHQLTNFVRTFYAENKGNTKIITLGKIDPTNTDPNLIIINKRDNFVLRLFKFTFATYKNKKVDFIFCQHALAAAIPSLLISKIFRIPLVINFTSDEIYERYLYIYKNNLNLENFFKEQNLPTYLKNLMRIQKFILKRADKIIVPNNYFRKLIITNYNLKENKVFTIYPFVENKFVLPFKTVKNNYSMMAQISLQKNALLKIEKIITEVVGLKNKFPNLELNIFGDGNAKQELENFVKNLHAENYVIFHGRVSHAELIHYKQTCGFFISLSPSVRNIFHLLENFEQSTISVVLNNELANEFIENKKTGIYLENLEEVLADESLQKEIIKNAKLELEDKYTVNKYVENLFNIIKL